MKFGECGLSAARGGVLAWAQKAGGRRFAKGARVDDEMLAAMRGAGVKKITVARGEAGDIGENEAAARIAECIVNAQNIAAGRAAVGRVNFYAACDGLFAPRARLLNQLNGKDWRLTLATLPARAPVWRGRLVATLKTIAFFAPKKIVDHWRRQLPQAMAVRPYAPRRAALVQTTLPHIGAAVLDKTSRVNRARLAACAARVVYEGRCPHTAKDLAEELNRARRAGAQLILVVGAGAVCDAADVAPAAVLLCGGKVLRLGMPVDPGNLTMLAKIKNTPVIAAPGSARSPKGGGVDWMLQRLCAGLPTRAAHIGAMGVGGLLSEFAGRPAPREGAAARGEKIVAEKEAARQMKTPAVRAVLLAAGSGKRMGGGKLLKKFRGRAVLEHAAAPLIAACARGKLAGVVCVVNDLQGPEAALLKKCFEEGKTPRGWWRLVKNPRAQSGVASSLRCGLRALDKSDGGALIALGDMPMVGADDIGAVVDAFAAAPNADFVLPQHRGRRGNPALIARRQFAAAAKLRGDSGARALFAGSKVETAAAGRGVLFDIDAPADLKKYGGENQ